MHLDARHLGLLEKIFTAGQFWDNLSLDGLGLESCDISRLLGLVS